MSATGSARPSRPKQDVVEALLANAELVKTETLTVELETLAADVKDPQVSVAKKVGA